MDSLLLTAEDVAKQLRIKKYTVYELIKRGELPSSRVGKQVRVSQADIDRYLRAGKTGTSRFTRPFGGCPEPSAEEASADPAHYAVVRAVEASAVIISGQDRCLDMIALRIPDSVLRSYTGCYNGLYALYNGRVTIAASHLWDAETDSYNYPFIRRLLPGLPVGVVRLAGRMQGLYVKKGNPLGIKGWVDLARPDVTMINREKGCGTRILLDQKLKLLKIDTAAIQGYSRESTSHMACASTVARGGADAGCGCRQGSENVSGVEFIPLQQEWYDFVFRLADRNTPAVRNILAYVLGDEFRQDLEMMGGYDTSQTGRYEEF
jgi:putative molybdopterin biosynthesis protein